MGQSIAKIHNSAELSPGIVVEKVTKNSAAERAGLQEGDVLLRWVRGDTRGVIESPFDLSGAEIEQAPRGPVTLEGFRGMDERTWTLGSSDWGVSARPDFQENLLSIYREGEDLAHAGKPGEAADRWRTMAPVSKPQPSWLDPWLLFHAAKMFAQGRKWNEGDDAYREALEQTAGSGPGIRAQIFQSWANTFGERNDWANAEKYYRQSIEESRRLGVEGLAVAASLDDLGVVFRQRGDLAKADEYCQSALDIKTTLAPGSLAEAKSQYDLGLTAMDRSDLSKAEKYLRQAADIRQKLAPGSLELASIFHSLGSVMSQRGDLENAENWYRQALDIKQRLVPETYDLVRTLNNLGRIAETRAKLADAEELYRRALEIEQKLAPGSLAFATIINNLGNVTLKRGDLARAEEEYRQALDIRQKLAPRSLDVAMTFNNLGLIAMVRGEMARAEDYLQQGLDIRQRLAPGSLDVATSLNNLGAVAYKRGDLVNADRYFHQALESKKKLEPGSLDLASTLGNLGTVAKERGDLSKADEYHRQELDIKRKLAPGSLDVASSFNNLGDTALERGDLAAAAEYHLQALDIKQKLAPGSLSLDIELGSLGLIAMRREDLAKAEEYFRQEIGIAEKLAPHGFEMAASLQHLGDLSRMRNALVNAEDYYHRALIIREKLAPGSRQHAESLASLAAVMQKQQPDAAARLFAQALDALENQMSRLGGADEVRSDFRAKRRGYYNDYIDLLLAEKQHELAFQVLERSRARSLLEMLAGAHIDIRTGVDTKLLEQERALQAALNTKSDNRIRLLSGKHTDEQVAALDREREGLVAQYQDVEAHIRLSSPSYAALTQPQPLSAKQLQQLLDTETVLLEYVLGEDRSYVFAVTPGSLHAYELPKRAEIEGLARSVYALLTERNHGRKDETNRSRQERLAKAEQETAQTTARLSRMVLGPLTGELGGKRLLIVSDGALEYIPFAVLPAPELSAGLKPAIPLLVDHEIVSLPSASVLEVLRREALSRKPAPKAVVVVADPVFDIEDARVKMASKTPGRIESRTRGIAEAEMDGSPHSFVADRLLRSAADVGMGMDGRLELPRLPFTRREAETILAVTPAGSTKSAFDFDASRATATSPELAQYRIIHFATHSILDSKHPELSGLVLSMVDRQGKAANGFLDLEDIYNLNLSADLVVLSACETGLGKEINGEGLVGLTRGFMYAGASRVVASLWKVDDVATAQLMGRFYKAMEQDGMRPAAALRQAQIQMWKQKRWSAPYYWAAFQIQGEWR